MGIIVLGVVAIYFIYSNRAHVRWLQCATIRIQQFLGLYCSNADGTLDEGQHDIWFSEQTIFPRESQKWRTGLWLEKHLAYMVANALSNHAGVWFVQSATLIALTSAVLPVNRRKGNQP